MIVTKKLQESFDKNREYPSDRLDYLISLWIDPKFAKQCEIMFEEVKVSVWEVVAVIPKIEEENKKILNLEWRATWKIIDITKNAANDRVYGWIKKRA